MDFDPQAGEVLLIDKELTWTSFDVVKRVRNLIYHKLGIKKCKVGHAGTLDPLATGLLIVCTGRKTKTINTIQETEKEYTGTFTFGKTTPSFDLETEVDKEWPWEHLTEASIQKAMDGFRGTIVQTPPVFSAKKVDGKRAYKSARAGLEVKMRPQHVDINAFEITACRLPEVDFRVQCSKGTYIRSLANDMGQVLESGAHLTALRRTRIGEFRIEDAMTVENFEAFISEQAASRG